MTVNNPQIRLLHRLARLYGVEVEYTDWEGLRHQASPETLLAVLKGLGASDGPADIQDSLRERSRDIWNRCCEPVVAAWEGVPVHLVLRIAASPTAAGGRLELEDGEVREFSFDLIACPLLATQVVDGIRYEKRRLLLASELPRGYHRLQLTLGTHTHHALLIVAPRLAHQLPKGGRERLWGAFMPLYALRSERGWGSGDYTDLGNLATWVGSLGGRIVGTLPLSASFLDEPFAPGPYQPVSRLFWNEFYLDVGRVEEIVSSPAARKLMESPEFQREVARLQVEKMVDYRRGMELKRSVLEHCTQTIFNGHSRRLADLHRWTKENPAALDYARFRATIEKQGTTFSAWPERQRKGVLLEGDYDECAARYHQYVQWLASDQLESVSARARETGQMLYLDLPLGVHPAGYDVWRENVAFVQGAGTGAPPDEFFRGGQNWEFPPPHPERVREQGYRYHIACLRNHLRYAGVLRLDHVAGLHRLFWIPKGLPAQDGVYVHYHAGELYAIACLESSRHQAVIVGEDLGTVPRYVRKTMSRHGIYRMYVLPFEFSEMPGEVLRPIPSRCLAALNTHDMAPFASFWREHKKKRAGLELTLFLARHGFLAPPTNNASAVRRACLAYLAASRAGITLVNLEDLWLEQKPQNTPGTSDDHPNWRLKARFDLDKIRRLPGITDGLGEINRLRCATRIKGIRTAQRFGARES